MASRIAGAIFPLVMYTPANPFLVWAKPNQIFSEEITRHITKLFCGVASVFMQENWPVTFIHTFAANPFYWLYIHLRGGRNPHSPIVFSVPYQYDITDSLFSLRRTEEHNCEPPLALVPYLWVVLSCYLRSDLSCAGPQSPMPWVRTQGCMQN